MLVKLLVTVTHVTVTTVLALATLGGATINRNDPICVTPPRVAKASKEGDITGIIALSFANVNTALWLRSKI